MRILVAGDLHFDKEQFEWIHKRQFDFGCICLTGDYLDIKRGDLEMQITWIQNWVRSIQIPMFICSGNHDINDFGESDWLQDLASTNVHVDDSLTSFKGLKIGVVPYLGAFWSNFTDCDILVSHLPPAKTKTSQTITSNGTKDWGDEELYLQLDQQVLSPKYIFCGHVEAPLAYKDIIHKTQIINPGNQSQVVEIKDVELVGQIV